VKETKSRANADKPRTKTADKPHYLSLIFSILAIVVSCFSWWESHSNRLISEEVNRPILSVGNIESKYGETLGNGEVVIVFDLALKNTGKFAAKVDKYVLEPILINSGSRCIPNSILGKSLDKVPSTAGPEILAGQETHLLGNATLSSECAKLPILEYLVDLSVSYADTTGKPYVQNFLQHINMSLTKSAGTSRNSKR
jgi:hypothetical protein